jgi:hypothetical protein
MKIDKRILIGCILTIAVGHAQAITHSCGGHRPTFWDAGHAGFADTGPWTGAIATTTDTTVETLIYGPLTEDNCSCGEETWTKTDTTSNTHSWDVNAGINGTVRSGLLASTIAKAEVSGHVAGSMSGSTNMTVAISISKKIPQCTRSTYKKFANKHSVTQTQSCAAENWTDAVPHSGKCDFETFTATCVGWPAGAGRDEFTSPGPCPANYPCDDPSTNCGG